MGSRSTRRCRVALRSPFGLRPEGWERVGQLCMRDPTSAISGCTFRVEEPSGLRPEVEIQGIATARNSRASQ